MWYIIILFVHLLIAYLFETDFLIRGKDKNISKEISKCFCAIIALHLMFYIWNY